MKKNDVAKVVICCLAFTTLLVMIIVQDDWFSKKESKNNSEKTQEVEFSYTPIMYKICDDDNCNYLLAAVHFGDTNVGKFSDVVNAAYDKSDYVAAELDVVNLSLDINDFLLPDGVTVDMLISEELNKKLEDFSKTHYLFPYDTYKKYKLSLIATELELLPFLEKGYLVSGTDTIILNRAHNDNKEVIALEELSDQMDLLLGYSDDFYINQIEEIIDNYDLLFKISMETYDAYMSADIEKLESLINLENSTSLEEDEYNEALLDDRNVIMAEKIRNFLNEDKNVFVVVGAAHIIGDGGIVDLLSEENYEISLLK